MLIRISGPVAVFDAASEDAISDPVRLRALDGLVYDADQCSNYFSGDVDLDAIGVTGGTLRLAFQPLTGGLRVVSGFTSPRKLKPKELKALVEETTGQWSDGIGEGIQDHWRVSHGVSIDFSPFDAGEPNVEQIDDGPKSRLPARVPCFRRRKRAIWPKPANSSTRESRSMLATSTE